MLKAAVVGASGYGGGELVRLLLQHPDFHLEAAYSETYAGKPLSASFPNLTGRSDLCFLSKTESEPLQSCDVVFMAQENGKAIQAAPELLATGKHVVDLSADFRFRDPGVYEAWYHIPHTAQKWNEEAVYGLPELQRDKIRKAKIVGNPGCYATASILGLTPLAQAGLIVPGSVIIDAKSGVSGAGRSKFSLDYHFPELNESLSAYKIAGTHRHTPEIEAMLKTAGGQEQLISFTPHLLPITRGLMATCYATLTSESDAESLRAIYRNYYAKAPFVQVTDQLPSTKHTVGTNMCHIGLEYEARTNRITVISVLDNLIKGAAGQAIQNMNLMCGLQETAGLELGGIWP